MSVNFPQEDAALCGGADAWEGGPAGVLLRDDYFSDGGVTSFDGDYIEIDLPAGLTNTIGTGNVTVDPSKVTVTQIVPSTDGTGTSILIPVDRRASHKADIVAGGRMRVWMAQPVSQWATSVSLAATAGAFTLGGSSGLITALPIRPLVQSPDNDVKIRLVGVVKSRTELIAEHSVITGTFYLEADGGHESGLSCVRFTVTDGVTTQHKYATQQERSRYQDTFVISDPQWSANCTDSGDSVRGGLGVYSSGTTFNAADFASGPITVTVTAYALAGGLSLSETESWPLYNNTDGSYTVRARYVDIVAGSDSNNGLTAGTAYATLQKAVKEAGSANLGATARSIPIVYVVGSGDPNNPRRHQFYDEASTSKPALAAQTDTWLTVKPAPGHTSKDTVFCIDSGSVRPTIRRLKIEGVGYDIRSGSPDFRTTGTILKTNTAVFPVATDPAAIWFDKVERYHSGGRVQNTVASGVNTLLDSSYNGARVICTNMIHRDFFRVPIMTGSVGVQRNIYWTRCTGDAIKSPSGVIFGLAGEDNTNDPFYLGFDIMTGTPVVGDVVTGVYSGPGAYATVEEVITSTAVVFAPDKVGTFKPDDNQQHKAVTVADGSGFVVGTTMTNGQYLYRKDGNVLRFQTSFAPTNGSTITQASPSFSSTVVSSATENNMFFATSGARGRAAFAHADGLQIEAKVDHSVLVDTVSGTFSSGEILLDGATNIGTFISLTTAPDGRQVMAIQSSANIIFDSDAPATLTGATSAATAIFRSWYSPSATSRNSVFTNIVMFNTDGQCIFAQHGSRGYLIANILIEQALAASGQKSQIMQIGGLDIWHYSAPKTVFWDRLGVEQSRRTRATFRGFIHQSFDGALKPGVEWYAWHAADTGETLSGDMTKGDPLYVNAGGYDVDPDPLTSNYELQSGSPARRFIPLADGAWKPFDAYGNRRPTNGTAALGAIEEFPLLGPVTADLYATEGGDTAAFAITPGETATLAATEGADTASFTLAATGSITFVGAQTATQAGRITDWPAITFALTGGLASTPAEGDLVIVFYSIGCNGNVPDPAISSPTDYTAGTQINAAGAGRKNRSNYFYKFMGATPDTSVTLAQTGATSDAGGAVILVFRGVDQTTPLDGITPSTMTGYGTAAGQGKPNPAPITPSSAGDWIVAFGAQSQTTTAVFTEPATGLDSGQFWSATQSDSNSVAVGGGYYSGWTSGAYDIDIFGGGVTNSTAAQTAYAIALKPGVGGGPSTITGTLNATEGADTAVFAIAAAHTATLAATEGADTATFAIGAAHTAALSATDGADTAAFAISARHTAALTATDGADTASFAISARHTAALSATEAGDTAAFAVTVGDGFALNATEGGDTAAFAVGLVAGVALAATEGADTAVFAIAARHTAALTATEGSDTAAGTLTAAHTAALAATEGADTCAAAVTVGSGASLNATEGADTASGTLAAWHAASLAATENGDTAVFAAAARHIAAMVATEGADTCACTITARHTAALAAVENADVAAFIVALAAVGVSDIYAFPNAGAGITVVDTSNSIALADPGNGIKILEV